MQPGDAAPSQEDVDLFTALWSEHVRSRMTPSRAVLDEMGDAMFRALIEDRDATL